MLDPVAIIARLKALVPDLGDRVSGASEWTRLTQSGAEPSVTPVAFVLPTGGVGGKHQGMTGAYVQPVELLVSVVLVLRTDTAGLRALDRLAGLIDDIVNAIAGWDIGLVGLFVFRRWQLIQAAKGTLTYEITFAIGDRIRKVIP